MRHAKHLLDKARRSKEWDALIGEHDLPYIEKAFGGVAGYLATDQKPGVYIFLKPE